MGSRSHNECQLRVEAGFALGFVLVKRQNTAALQNVAAISRAHCALAFWSAAGAPALFTTRQSGQIKSRISCLP